MPRRSSHLRYIVTGPAIDGEPSYAHVGQALSRTLTAANVAAMQGVEGTWYARDSLDGDRPVGYSESDGKLVVTVGQTR